MHDVIIVDEEFTTHDSEAKATCAQIEAFLTRYLAIMTEASTAGAVSGQAAEALRAYVARAKALQNAVTAIGELHGMASAGFLGEIEAADVFKC